HPAPDRPVPAGEPPPGTVQCGLRWLRHTARGWRADGSHLRPPGRATHHRSCPMNGPALVELVDGTGTPPGTATVEQAHEWPGVLHRAFSVLLFDPAGRTLLQRRAAAKTRFALR